MQSLPFVSPCVDGQPLRGGVPRTCLIAPVEAPSPAPAVFSATAAAVMAAGPNARELQRGWRELDGAVVYDHRPAGGPRVRVRLTSADAADAWARLEGFSALSLDALLVAARPTEAADAETVLRAKGYARCGDERRIFRAQVEAELDRLLALRVQTSDAAEPLPVFERCGAGVRPREELRRELRAVPPPGAALRFDHRANRGADVLAKKLAAWLALCDRDEPLKARPIRAVLAGIGELPANIGERGARSGRLADRFDEALLRLEEAGLSRLRYRGDSAAGGDRSRGWIARWLRQTLVAAPPAAAVLSPAWRPRPPMN